MALTKSIIDNGIISTTFRETDRAIRIIEKNIIINGVMRGCIRESEAVFRIIVNGVGAEGDIVTTVALDTILVAENVIIPYMRRITCDIVTIDTSRMAGDNIANNCSGGIGT